MDSLKKIKLYESKYDCCGCCACMNICPQNAIIMAQDECGFIYPLINQKKCISCGACERVCAYKKRLKQNELTFPLKSYAVALKDEERILNVASGGVFTALAIQFYKNNNYVFGSTLIKENDNLNVKHISTNKINELKKLQGSKYVHSYIGYSYKEVKKVLLTNQKILFSGTPCQIDGLKTYLGKDYDNLFTVDLICHGVPSLKYFQSYIKSLEKKERKEVSNFKFRDKKQGWGLKGSVEFYNEKYKPKIIYGSKSSYYLQFLRAEIYRINCYKCPYANCSRVGDITIGDFWGVNEKHPEFLIENGGSLSIKKGISCVLVNSQKGVDLVNEIKNDIVCYECDYKDIADKNTQLKEPSKIGKYRKNLLNIYALKGYNSAQNFFYRRIKLEKIIVIIKKIVPSFLWDFLKNFKKNRITFEMGEKEIE